jgi:hypothetical protein
MNLAAGPFAIAATLLIIGGSAKVVAPFDTATALGGLGLRIPAVVVRAGAALEGAIGLYALVIGDRIAAALVALSFAVFFAFVCLALGRRAPIATCGCFGRADSPPSVVHLAIDAGAVLAAAAVVVDPGVALADVVGGQPLAGAPYLLLVVTGVYLAYVAMTALPRTLASVRLSEERRA